LATNFTTCVALPVFLSSYFPWYPSLCTSAPIPGFFEGRGRIHKGYGIRRTKRVRGRLACAREAPQLSLQRLSWCAFEMFFGPSFSINLGTAGIVSCVSCKTELDKSHIGYYYYLATSLLAEKRIAGSVLGAEMRHRDRLTTCSSSCIRKVASFKITAKPFSNTSLFLLDLPSREFPLLLELSPMVCLSMAS